MKTWADLRGTKAWSSYKPCPKCGNPCGRNNAYCRTCSPLIRGEHHYAWKGDAASTTTKRERTQKLYQLGQCEMCGERATDRHHRDGDTGNNVADNIACLCRRCHMQADGRLDTRRRDGTFASIYPVPYEKAL